MPVDEVLRLVDCYRSRHDGWGAKRFYAWYPGTVATAAHAGLLKPYVKENKNDFNDAEAIFIAVTRPDRLFVAVKTVKLQDLARVCPSGQMDFF